MGNSAHCKTYFGKANHTFLFGAELIYGSSFQRRELFAHLFSRPCKGRLKTTQRLTQTKIFIKTRDQPEPGCLFHRAFWGGDMKDPGNEVG